MLKSVWRNAERCGATSNPLILITVRLPGFWSGFTLTFLLTHMWNQDVCEYFPHRKLASLYSFSVFRSDSSPPLTRAQHIPPNHTHLSNPTWPPSMGRDVWLIMGGFTNRKENDPRNHLRISGALLSLPKNMIYGGGRCVGLLTRDYIMKWRGNLRERWPLTEQHLVYRLA